MSELPIDKLEMEKSFLKCIDSDDVLQIAVYLQKDPSLANMVWQEQHDHRVLVKALLKSGTPVLDMLIEYGADVTHRNKSNHTALHSAIAMGKNIEVIDLLVRNGADPNVVNSMGSTPFTYSLNQQLSHRHRFPQIIEYLLEKCLIDQRLGTLPSKQGRVSVSEYIKLQLESVRENGNRNLEFFFVKVQRILKQHLEQILENERDVEIER